MSEPYVKKGTRFLWIAPYINGAQVHQSSKCVDFESARRKLRILEGKIAENAPITAHTDRKSFAAVIWLVHQNYEIKHRKSIDTLKGRIENHLLNIHSPLAALPSAKVTTTEIDDYIAKRQTEGAADASINAELAIIKRGFRLAQRAGMVSSVPYVELLPLDNARQGFFTAESFQSALRHVESDLLRDVMIVAYTTGWRLSSILSIEWSQVDLRSGLLRLYSTQTKNKKATICPLALFPELRAMLERRAHARTDLIPYLFHQDGKRVTKSMLQKPWARSMKAAGLPGMKRHDLRRTAVRNLKDMGWDDTDIMSMVGLKTREMLIRYNITTDNDILRKGKAMAERLGIAPTREYDIFCNSRVSEISASR